MPHRILLIVYTIFIVSCSPSANENTSLLIYPDVLPDADTAAIFAFGSISSDSIEHSAPSFSPDGKTILWSVMYMPNYRSTILEMTYNKGKWSVPHMVAFADSTANDIYPAFGPDGNTVYFSSSRKMPSGKNPSRGNMLWKVSRAGAGWSTPELLDTLITRGGDYAPSVSSTGVLYFTHGPFRTPDWNIVAVQDFATHPTFITLDSTVNSPDYEDGPFIAPDNSYLIFESNRAGGVGGSIDLYISFFENGKSSSPLNMGPKINTEATERFARISPDGKYLFFGSDRRKVNGKPNMDVYAINASVIEELRKTNKSLTD